MEILPTAQPIPIKDRLSVLFLKYGNLDVSDGAFVLVDATGVRTHVPVGSIACLLLEPGTRVSHAAVKLASTVGCLLVWVGEAGVRLYAAGQPGGARSDRLLYQAQLALDESARLKVVRKMFQIRFQEEAPKNRSVMQLRGIEGARVRRTYEILAQKYRVAWRGRRYDPKEWELGDLTNRCLSAGTACLYGVTEAAVLAAGYAPAIGFLHTGKPLSFVYDIADLVKFETVVPVAFEVAGRRGSDRDVRIGCREVFRKTSLLKKIIPLIEEVLAAGELAPPVDPEYAVEPAFENEKGPGDVGHRN